MRVPAIYGAITAITADLASTGIPKNHVNRDKGYSYRSIDDLLDRLAPLLPKHGLCIFPRVLKRTSSNEAVSGGEALQRVILSVQYDLISSEDASRHRIRCIGEALDDSDKATSKAMSSAFKMAMLQLFCVPSGEEDADRRSPKVDRLHEPEPASGWAQWSADIGAMIASCMSIDAVDTIQDRQRILLKALSREQPALYKELGKSFTARRSELAKPKSVRAKTRISKSSDAGRVPSIQRPQLPEERSLV